MALIELDKVSKVYRMGDVEVHAMREVSLAVEERDFVAVMGSSGSGKSTLMNIIGCLDRPSSGAYRLDGDEVSRLDRRELARVRNKTLGFVFQSFNLLSRTSALENVELPLLYGGVAARERHGRALEALGRVGLAERVHHRSNEMSGGQQQRVAVARALVTRPRLILADEPTGNLDSRTTVEIMVLFQELAAAGITILLVTHEPDVAAYASRVVVMRDGRVRTDTRQAPRQAAADLAASARDDDPHEVSGVIPLETFRVALRALLRNKMRSFLTVLGIIIGVGAVIAMVAIGEGAKAQVEASFASMGSNLLIVLPGSTQSSGARGGFGTLPTLTWDDLRAIQREATAVRYAAVQLRSNAQLMSDDQNWATQVNGTAPEYFQIRNWRAERGRLLLDSDVESSAKVVVLGQTVVDKLYGAVDPVGQTVRIKNIPFEVVGVMEKKGQSPIGQDYDDVAFVPQTTFQTKIQGGLQKFISGTIFLGATSTDATARAETQVSNLLRDRHHLDAGADDDFSIRNLTEMANAQAEGTRTLTTLLASIAGVSLLVGGIGIMNIMLVSVTERTREIGVRMAVGATPLNILMQFLVEALTLAVAGGMIGVALGVFAAGRLGAKFGWPTLVRPDIVVISVCFSGLVGVVFGLYPARKASQLDPIDALRYE